MAHFLDGPAAGIKLLLHRAPFMLRAACARGTHRWDALDGLHDEAEADESIAVYRYAGDRSLSRFHISRRPRSQSGWYEDANYRVLREQPADADVRTTKAWQAWCMANADKLREGVDLSGYRPLIPTQ